MDKESLRLQFEKRSLEMQREIAYERMRELEEYQEDVTEDLFTLAHSVFEDNTHESQMIVVDKDVEDSGLGKGSLVAYLQIEKWVSGTHGRRSIRLFDAPRNACNFAVRYCFRADGDRAREYLVDSENFPTGQLVTSTRGMQYIKPWHIYESTNTPEQAEAFVRLMEAQLLPEDDKPFDEQVAETVKLLSEAARDPELNPAMAARIRERESLQQSA